MPKPRAKQQLSAAEEAIIAKGGEPGAASLAEPSRKEAAVQPTATPAPDLRSGSKRPAMIQTMARFTPEQMSEIEESMERFEQREGVRISMNKWIVRACMAQVQRDK